MENQVNAVLSLIPIILLAATVGNSQPKPVYTRYVNSFIGTAPLYDPKIIGYEAFVGGANVPW